MDGSFVADQIGQFREEAAGDAIVVQVRGGAPARFKLFRIDLGQGVRGYFLLTRLVQGRAMEWISAMLLVTALLRARAWRYDVLHFHIAYPLLIHVRCWHWIFRKPIIISEHWSAYHYDFHLVRGSKAMLRMQRPSRASRRSSAGSWVAPRSRTLQWIRRLLEASSYGSAIA